jgi:Zn-dependent peptidase ImmA (M78 family)
VALVHAGKWVIVGEVLKLENEMGIDRESEANQFAFELLMPRKMLLKDIKDWHDFDALDQSAVHVLSNRYGVDDHVMGMRLQQVMGVSK